MSILSATKRAIENAPAKIAERNAGIANGTLAEVWVPGKDIGGGIMSTGYLDAVPAKNGVPITSGNGYQTITSPYGAAPAPKTSNAKKIGIAAGGVIVVIVAIIFFLKA